MAGILDSTNQNLTPLQKIWLRWHTKLGHIGFAHVQKLGVGGYLDKLALGLLRCTGNSHPVCTACQYGKQTRTHDHTTTTTKDPENVGALKEGKINPGDRIFCDHLT